MAKIKQTRTKKKVKIQYVKKCKNCGKFAKQVIQVLKFNFTKDEIKQLKSKIYLTEMQERILDYRLQEYSIVKMSMLEHCSESTISREIKKIKKKIMRVL